MISSTAAHDGDFVDAGEVQYLYDGNGRRIQKIFAGTATADQDVYFNEDFQALETRWNGSTNAYEQHVWDLKYIDAPILRYRDANGHTSSTSTGDGTSEEVLYFTFDANFNITGLVQENQTFVERYVYTPYGDRLVLTGTFGSRGTTNYDQQLGHQGLYTDVESGTIYNRGRQGYHPSLGNFTQRDPRLADYQDGPNLYQGYRGNPVIYVDPMGYAAIDAKYVKPPVADEKGYSFVYALRWPANYKGYYLLQSVQTDTVVYDGTGGIVRMWRMNVHESTQLSLSPQNIVLSADTIVKGGLDFAPEDMKGCATVEVNSYFHGSVYPGMKYDIKVGDKTITRAPYGPQNDKQDASQEMTWGWYYDNSNGKTHNYDHPKSSPEDGYYVGITPVGKIVDSYSWEAHWKASVENGRLKFTSFESIWNLPQNLKQKMDTKLGGS